MDGLLPAEREAVLTGTKRDSMFQSHHLAPLASPGKGREGRRVGSLCLLETMPHRISICLGGLLETRMLCFCLWEGSPVASVSDVSWGRLDFFSILVLWGKLLVSADAQGMVKDVWMDEPGEKEHLAAWNHPVFCFVSLLALHSTSLQ